MQEQNTRGRGGCHTDGMREIQNNRRDTGMSLTSSTRLTCLTSLNTGGQRTSHPMQCNSKQHDLNRHAKQHDLNRHAKQLTNQSYSDNYLAWQNVNDTCDKSKTTRNKCDHVTCEPYRKNITCYNLTNVKSVRQYKPNMKPDQDSSTGSVSGGVTYPDRSVVTDDVGNFFISPKDEHNDLIPCLPASSVSNVMSTSSLNPQHVRAHTRCTSL